MIKSKLTILLLCVNIATSAFGSTNSSFTVMDYVRLGVVGLTGIATVGCSYHWYKNYKIILIN